MEYKSEQELRISHLRFIGKVLSVFTHELNNHLAIIKESAGLVEDTLKFQRSAGKYDIEESLKVIRSIENQIGKTSWICKKLNGFGHRMDKPLSTFSVNESIEELLVLLSRIANQKRVGFEKDLQEGIPPLHNDPAMLQLVVFCLIDRNLNTLDSNGSILLKTSHSSGSITISIVPKGNVTEPGGEEICSEDICQYVVAQLGGSISHEAAGGGVTITLPAQGISSVSG